ncbi:hypothetical protein PF003_g22653 [Phytophthora fragariae]|nr:hypothetical protein PF003_g22653 [Phytophthora fragariae]
MWWWCLALLAVDVEVLGVGELVQAGVEGLVVVAAVDHHHDVVGLGTLGETAPTRCGTWRWRCCSAVASGFCASAHYIS